jgi:hypothetical protein
MHFDYAEADVLAAQLDELAGMIAEELDGSIRDRLFPPGHHDDPLAAEEFRVLTEQGLRDTKLERIGQCRAEIPVGGGDVQLDAEGTERWLTVLNDLRLTIGTLLDVREDDDPTLDPDDPEVERRVIYYWLTELQDNLVHAAMG